MSGALTLAQDTVINQYSLLYEWKGTDPSLQPYLLAAHLDVVPTPDLHLWQHPPFSGHHQDGVRTRHRAVLSSLLLLLLAVARC